MKARLVRAFCMFDIILCGKTAGSKNCKGA
jgi:hypothetical protein